MARIALCIGAPRSGTTWLGGNLRTHPEIFVPPIKEVRHFFSRPSEQDAENLIAKVWHSASAADRRWLASWRTLRSDGEYLLLMTDVPAEVSIDITPAYCAAPRQIVDRVKDALGGQARIVFLLRDPVERDWSHLNQFFHLQRGETTPKDETEYLALLSRDDFVRRSDYLGALDLWCGAFGQDAVHIEFYDEIRSSPEAVLRRVTEFLGVFYTPGMYAPTVAEHFESASSFGAITAPESIKPKIAERQIANLHRLAKRFPVAEKWLANAVELLAK